MPAPSKKGKYIYMYDSISENSNPDTVPSSPDRMPGNTSYPTQILSIDTLNQRNGGEWLKVPCGSSRGDNRLGVTKNSELPYYADMVSEVAQGTATRARRAMLTSVPRRRHSATV
ncbi:hypothetical protein EAM01S_04_00710 [Erwinia amylovora NBRC 12687 = CFBP 1232]|nr:hypothetical protein EAM01S_04_00710 [Erwinia amylovora NBRC 12687 = CFBP 1232]